MLRVVTAVIKGIAILALVVFVVVYVSRFICQKTTLHQTKITTEKGIDETLLVTIDDIGLHTLIRGEDSTNPVLLFVHGGPGTPSMPMHRHYDHQLTDQFTIVHFDQRASGKSVKTAPVEDQPKIETYLQDLVKMSRYLSNRFNQEKVWLVGHSWGSLIGLRAAHQFPELYHAYIGMGQITNMHEAEIVTYNYAMTKAREAGDEKIISILQSLDGPPLRDPQQVSVHRKCLRKMGGALKDESFRHHLTWQIFNSPEYSIPEMYRTFKASRNLWPNMWAEMLEVNFFEEIDTMPIPIHIISGRYDWQVPSTLAEEFVNGLIAPAGKMHHWFEESGHLPNYEEAEKYHALIREIAK